MEEEKDYICKKCGLGLHIGLLNPENDNKHIRVGLKDVSKMCGPVVEVPLWPEFVVVKDEMSGKKWGVSRDRLGVRMRKLFHSGRCWETVGDYEYRG